MGELFSKISGQLSGPILISAFFPVLLFLTAFTLVVLPITPYGHDFTDAVMDPKVWEAKPFVTLMLTVVVLAISIVLYNMNIHIIRLYEGYPWKDSWIGKFMQQRQSLHLERVTVLRERITKLRSEKRKMNISVPLNSIESQGDLARAINNYYPEPESVLPTRLGNTIRAFETYPIRQYKISAIALWPRLQAVVDGSLAESLDSAKTAFDFMIHSAFLSGILATFTIASGLYWQTHAAHLSYGWIVWSIVFATASCFFYNAAISRAIEWGSQVKAAFDLYRLPLLEKLGYETKPLDLEDERRIWENLNNGFVFPDRRDDYPDIPYKQPSCYLEVEPPATIVNAKRTITAQNAGVFDIALTISNQDPAAFIANSVIVCEAIPSGKQYVENSAKIDGSDAPLLSIDPLKIDIGRLENQESRTVIYQIKE